MSSVVGKTLVTTGVIGSLVMAGYLWKDEQQNYNFAARDLQHQQSMSVSESVARATLESKAAANTLDLAVIDTPTVVPTLDPASVRAIAQPMVAENVPASLPSTDDLPAMAKVRMSRAVQELAAQAGDGMVEVIVAYNAADADAENARVAALGGEVQASFKHLPMRAIRVPAERLIDLAENNGVRVIDVNAPVQAASVSGRMTSNVPAVGSSDYWPASQDVTIAVVDSGVAPHNDITLLNSVACLNVSDTYMLQRQFGYYSAGCQTTTAGDSYGHGTHIAGSAGGSGGMSSGMHEGVAPGAPVVSLQVLDDNGAGTTLNVIAALDWILENRVAHNIRVVNMSLGKVVQESNEVDPLVLAAEAVWDAGVVVVASAGNYGTYGEFTIVSPGNSRKVITVGALTDNRTGAHVR